MRIKLHLNNLSFSRPARVVVAVALLLTSASVVLGQSNSSSAQADMQSTPYSPLSIENSDLVNIVSSQPDPWSVGVTDRSAVSPINKGQGVKIAILDTGMCSTHPDLKMAGGLSFVPGTDGADDDNGHGTILAGIIGAQDNNIGIVGVAPEAEIYAVKVIGRDGNGDTSAVVKGIKWSIANQMQIINLSFGDPNQLPDEVVNALQEAYDAGILIVAGAGNSGRNGNTDSICYPAKYEMVLSVGSTDQYNNKSDFSSTGPRLDVVAPGQNITSCNNRGDYSISSGTSNSAAYVSGVAALLIFNGVSDNQVIKQILESSAIDLGAPGYDTEYGHGLIDAEKALSLITSLNPDLSF